MDKRQVVVVTAFACDPNIPSEPTIGWSFLRAIMDVCSEDGRLDVIAYMNERSKEATDTRLNELDLQDRVTTVGVRLPKVLGFLKDPRLTRLEALVWARSTAGHLHSLSHSRHILLARHVTFASELLPTPISSLRGRALTAWGPVGCSGQANVFLIQPRHPRWKLQFVLQRLRDALSSIAAAHIAKSVDIVIATSDRLAEYVRNESTKGIVFPNTMLDEDLIESINTMRHEFATDVSKSSEIKPLTILCVGNLVYLKRFELAISALTHPSLNAARLVIVGKPASGQENYLAPIAEGFGVSDRVSFLGQIPRSEVMRKMFEADVLFHPSTREGGSGVVGEATTIGLPVVCFGGTGASVVLESSGVSGVVLPPDKDLSVARLATELLVAASKPRIASSKWSRARYQELERQLIELAWLRQTDAP